MKIKSYCVVFKSMKSFNHSRCKCESCRRTVLSNKHLSYFSRIHELVDTAHVRQGRRPSGEICGLHQQGRKADNNHRLMVLSRQRNWERLRRKKGRAPEVVRSSALQPSAVIKCFTQVTDKTPAFLLLLHPPPPVSQLYRLITRQPTRARQTRTVLGLCWPDLSRLLLSELCAIPKTAIIEVLRWAF